LSPCDLRTFLKIDCLLSSSVLPSNWVEQLAVPGIVANLKVQGLAHRNSFQLAALLNPASSAASDGYHRWSERFGLLLPS
jgi:hypothetical protein